MARVIRTGMISGAVLLGALAFALSGLDLADRGAGAAARPVPEAPPPGGTIIPELAHSGTATGIAPGLLLTNSHVVRACGREGRAIRILGLPGAWRVRQEDADADLALLEGPPAAGNAALPVSSVTQLSPGTAVAALGFPAGGAAGAPGIATGHVLRAALTIRDPSSRHATSFVMHDRNGREVQPSWEDGVRYFGPDRARHLRWLIEVDASVLAGSSGGPLVDGAGNLVGIVFAGDPHRARTHVVPPADVRDFLRQAGAHPRFGVRALAAPEDWQDLGRSVAAAVYQVRC